MRRLIALIIVGMLTLSIAPALAQTEGGVDIVPIGTYETGLFDEGAQEIGAYDPVSQRLFVTNADADSVDILDISDPTTPTLITSITFEDYGDSVNSVDVYDSVVAVAVEAEDVDANGFVVFMDTDGTEIGAVEAGVLPDMVIFTPDGAYTLSANEGEPNDDYDIDPEGSVTIIDNATGEAVTVGFTDFNADGARADELPEDVRIFGPNATVAQDLEPEYIAVSPDSTTAYVSLQENNAIAVIDIANAEVVSIMALGFKDHSLPENALDAGNDDGIVNITTWQLLGMYQPDAIVAYEVDGNVYLVTANEGDTRDYDGYSEEGEIGESAIDEAFPNLDALLSEDAILGLGIVESTGDTDGDGDLDVLYVPGARSFSIWDAANGEQVYDSGTDFETITAELLPDDFNSTNDENDDFDGRSDNKGPEPEGVTLGVIGERTFAFIGLERIGGIMIYDVTNPTSPAYITYVNNRDFSGNAEDGTAGDLGPEGLIFISAEDSPNGSPLLVVTNEVSGTTTIYEIIGM